MTLKVRRDQTAHFRRYHIPTPKTAKGIIVTRNFVAICSARGLGMTGSVANQRNALNIASHPAAQIGQGN